MRSISRRSPNGFGVKRALEHLGFITLNQEKQKGMTLLVHPIENDFCFLWASNEPISSVYMDIILYSSGVTYEEMEKTGVLYNP